MLNGIIEIDVHGKNVEAAIEEIIKCLNNVKPGVYRIRIIHGYRGGRAGSCDRKMNKFVTVSESRTVTAHGIFNS